MNSAPAISPNLLFLVLLMLIAEAGAIAWWWA